MLKFLRNKKNKGQSAVEYTILIIIVIGALLSIQVYIKRGLSGRLKQAADDIGDQYSDGNTNYVMITNVSSRTLDTFIKGETKSLMLQNEVTPMFTQSNIINVQQEFWGVVR